MSKSSWLLLGELDHLLDSLQSELVSGTTYVPAFSHHILPISNTFRPQGVHLSRKTIPPPMSLLEFPLCSYLLKEKTYVRIRCTVKGVLKKFPTFAVLIVDSNVNDRSCLSRIFF